MYIYDETDRRMAERRVAEFKDQTQRFLAGQLSEEAYRQLGLRNGVSLQKHSPALRLAVRYGMLSSRQLRALARVARRWDKGYASLGKRQTIQLNWPRLEDVPQILAELAGVQLYPAHAAGTCIRDTSGDHLAGVAPGASTIPLLWGDIIGRWSSLADFTGLPRRIRFALADAHEIGRHGIHDVHLQPTQRDGVNGFRIRAWSLDAEFIAWPDVLTYLETALRVYCRRGGPLAAFAEEVALQWAPVRGGPATLRDADMDAAAARFTSPGYVVRPDSLPDSRRDERALAAHAAANEAFANWLKRKVSPHRAPGYALVTISLKAAGVPPGDMGSDQMDALADLAEAYGFGELRVSHERNLILGDVRRSDLYALWQQLHLLRLAAPA